MWHLLLKIFSPLFNKEVISHNLFVLQGAWIITYLSHITSNQIVGTCSFLTFLIHLIINWGNIMKAFQGKQEVPNNKPDKPEEKK